MSTNPPVDGPLPGLSLGLLTLVSDSEASTRWLREALGAAGSLRVCGVEPDRLAERLGTERGSLVVIDFSEPQRVPAAELAQRAALALPQSAIVALGRAADAAAALAALRAGVREFIDTEAPPADALAVLARLVQAPAAPRVIQGTVVSLVGARPGVGTSTLAAHLAVMLQEHLKREQRGAALLDLGIPVGDSQVLLETRGSFSFAEAARSQHRIDATFVQSALPRHASGLAVLSLPANVAELRELSHASAVSVTQRLRSFVDLQLIDLGGFANQEFIAQVAAISDHCLMVCDQGAPSVISALELTRTLRARGLRPQLVVSKADDSVDPSPAQIAERLELPLLMALPNRSTALLQAMNTGRLLSQVAPGDPYVKLVRQLLARLLPEGEAAVPAASAPVSGPVAGLRQWIGSLRKGGGRSGA